MLRAPMERARCVAREPFLECRARMRHGRDGPTQHSCHCELKFFEFCERIADVNYIRRRLIALEGSRTRGFGRGRTSSEFQRNITGARQAGRAS
jgi:hypothetical protein